MRYVPHRRLLHFLSIALLIFGNATASPVPLPGTTVVGDIVSKSYSAMEQVGRAARSSLQKVIVGDETDPSDAPVDVVSPPETPPVDLRPRVVTLNVMVAGLSGLGKTTTCQSLLELWTGGEIKE